MRFVLDEKFDNVAKLKVIGVGGGGGNAVNHMVDAGLTGVDFIAVNTDEMALNHNRAPVRIQIGKKLTNGLGAGTCPEIGRAAMEEDRERVKELLVGADMVFITAGMGGGTGTGGAPIVAELARELGILSVAIVTRPFEFEGFIRKKNYKKGIEELRKHADTIIVVPNQKLLSIIDRSTPILEAFKTADDVLYHGTKGISDIITRDGLISVDFADVRTVMKGMGDALMGTGYAEGDNTSDRALTALDSAISSPLLDDINICGARGLIINFTGGRDMAMLELADASQKAYETVGEDSETNIVVGAVIDEDMEGAIKVTVIATGFNDESMEMFRDEKGSAALKVALPPPVKEKVEQTKLVFTENDMQLTQTTAPKSPAETVMAAQGSLNPVAAMADAFAVRMPSVATETIDKKEQYKGFKTPFATTDYFAPKVYGGVEDIDTPTYLRKQQQ
ncbi:MAG: cell division protein FtsZ [Chitinispirillia bacterium]|nr:cell division protein FtsZ [Chitinispirillia bacterium]MCL2267798.1 cell division protein FtsZ [Chitinispirillia bacterium]